MEGSLKRKKFKEKFVENCFWKVSEVSIIRETIVELLETEGYVRQIDIIPVIKTIKRN